MLLGRSHRGWQIQGANLDKGQSQLLRDLWATYEMQIVAMKKANKEGNTLTADLYGKMAEQLLEAYFDLVEKVL